MHVRDATEADIEGIRAVADEAWRTDYPERLSLETIETGVNHWYGDPVLRMELSQPGTLLQVAEDEDSLVGFVHAHMAGPQPTILRLHVRPAYRESGVEAALFESVEAKLDAPEELQATVLEPNDHMLGFYDKRGFEQVDTEETTIGEDQYPEAVLARM